MSKFCPNCGNELEKDVKFCSSCGSTINGDANQSVPVNNNYVTVNTQNNSNGMAVAGFVISLVSFFLCCGSLNWLSLIFSIVGLVQAKSKNGNGKGLAIAGIVISCIVMVLFIILMITGMFAGLAEEIANI